MNEGDLLAACGLLERLTGLGIRCEVEGETPAVCLGPVGPLRVRRVASVTPGNVEEVIAEAGPGEEIIFADRVTPRAAERLREQGIAFLDHAGNAFVHDAGVFLFVCGRSDVARSTSGTRARAFRPKGLRVVFALLCRPGLLDASYRQIAGRSGVALGTVTGVMSDLERLGYIHHGDNGRAWANRAGLQHDWAKAYQRELRPRLNAHRYRVATNDWWRTVDPAAYGFRLGGEAGAAWLTDYIEPGEVSLYGNGDFKSLAREIRPVRDDAGNLEVLEAFWPFDCEPESGPVVPPLLVYADLLASPADRVREVADIIWDKFLV